MKYQLLHNSDPKSFYESDSSFSPSSSTSSMDLVSNGSVDFRGRVANKRTTGGRRASPFIIANEAAERLSAFTVSASLVLYLTKEMKESLPDAATHVSDWVGATYLLMLLGAFLADAYLGRFLTVIVSSVVYLAKDINGGLVARPIQQHDGKRSLCSGGSRPTIETQSSGDRLLGDRQGVAVRVFRYS